MRCKHGRTPVFLLLRGAIFSGRTGRARPIPADAVPLGVPAHRERTAEQPLQVSPIKVCTTTYCIVLGSSTITPVIELQGPQ